VSVSKLSVKKLYITLSDLVVIVHCIWYLHRYRVCV